jgi:hypothetical protein
MPDQGHVTRGDFSDRFCSGCGQTEPAFRCNDNLLSGGIGETYLCVPCLENVSNRSLRTPQFDCFTGRSITSLAPGAVPRTQSA